MPLTGKTIILGVTGGIAAYKSADLCSRLIKANANVHVVMTVNATRFVGTATFQALTGHQVITSLWDEPREFEITHISLSDKADAFIIAPATANIIGKIANGIADDMLTTTIMAATAPVIMAPAMNTKMWNNPIVQQNISKITSLGYKLIPPQTGRLACGSVGTGKMAEPEEILDYVKNLLQPVSHDLDGLRLIVTAGPTIEPIDPVRFIMNHSSGKMGYAIAEAALKSGAAVTLVSGPTSLVCSPEIELVLVKTASEMCDAVLARFDKADVLIGAAAPADFTPVEPADKKIKKSGNSGLTLHLKQTPDILVEAGKRKKSQIIIAFAAETNDLEHHAVEKLHRKNADFIVANDVSRSDIGFASDMNEVTIIDKNGIIDKLPKLSKLETADRILDKVYQMLRKS